ncbi:GspH/FimT family pseudopilin [Desulfonatronum thioautotrophicum]|uniref:GspH/FimT family pseudopilin n=1 Tax=Desulfonatronum thioautotrophicum TaxID=617001 RepID=UPI0006995D74|nr:GspH/FimT family pseudopilin [Desulfonatronum thioautotrophicum]
MIGFQPNRESGFSIIEVLIVVAIASILTAIAIPAFNVFIGNTRVSTVTNEFVSALNLARSEAIKRGGDVHVCRSSNGATCATSGHWGQGWLIADENDTPIRVREGLREPSSFAGNGTLATNTNTRITFSRDGRVLENVDASFLQVQSKGRSMCIRINSAGRVRSESGACS